jgi:predicted PurR-regulated permease PerM
MNQLARKRLRPEQPDEAESAGIDPGLLRILALGVGATAVIAVLAALAYAHVLAVPIVAGLTIGFILGPLTDRAGRLGIPSMIANAAIIAAVIAALYVVSILFVPVISDVLVRAPELAGTIRDKLGDIERSLATVNDLARLLGGESAGRSLQVRVETGDAAAVASVVGAITPAFAQLVIFVFTMILFLASRRSLRDRAVLAIKRRENRLTALKIFSDIEDRMLGYFATVTTINLGLGVLTGIAMWLLGLPGAPVWGFLAFVLNFLPVVGPLILKVVLLGAGVLAMPNLSWALAPPLAYFVFQLLEANVVTPWLVGRKLTLEPLLIFLAICFFTFLWGPVGAFLATPLVIVALIIHQHATPDAAVPLPDREEPAPRAGVDPRTSNNGAKR